MEFVDVRYAKRGQHKEEKDMPENEIRSEHSELGDLADKFTSWLRDRVPSHGVPFSSPPRNVARILLELTCETQSND